MKNLLKNEKIFFNGKELFVRIGHVHPELKKNQSLMHRIVKAIQDRLRSGKFAEGKKNSFRVNLRTPLHREGYFATDLINVFDTFWAGRFYDQTKKARQTTSQNLKPGTKTIIKKVQVVYFINENHIFILTGYSATGVVKIGRNSNTVLVEYGK